MMEENILKKQHRGSVNRCGNGKMKLVKWSKSKKRKQGYLFLSWETSNGLGE